MEETRILDMTASVSYLLYLEKMNEPHTFIDRYFHSQYELLDMRKEKERDINTLYTFLNNLHSTADKLKNTFNSDIKEYPEFKVLRVIRNYFHHVDDVDEIRMFVSVDEATIVSHSQHILIPLEIFAKSVKSFISNNTVSKKNRNYERKKKFIDNEMDTIADIFDYTADLLANLDMFCDNPRLKLDGKVHSLGFDMYKFIYNISNIIADLCRDIPELRDKAVIRNLDDSYSTANNIGKWDVFTPPSKVPITTTEGFVYAEKIELVA